VVKKKKNNKKTFDSDRKPYKNITQHETCLDNNFARRRHFGAAS
jgi:hypothetical protein